MPSQPHKPKPKRRTNKPASVQADVVARTLAGHSKRKISRDLGISHVTIATILSDSDLTRLIDEGKRSVHALIPKAVRAFDRQLDKDNAQVATRVLEGTGVLISAAERQPASTQIKLVILNANNRPPRIPPSDNGHEPTNGDSSIQ